MRTSFAREHAAPFGTARNGRVEFAFLRDWYAADTAEVFTGEIRGDTIVGFYRGQGGPVRFVRQR